MYVNLPLWLVAGFADYLCHRAAHIERTSGCEIVGPISTLEEAIATVRQNHLDGALLDANLNGGNSSSVADELLSQEVPFILVTGYGGHKADPPVLARAPRVGEPINFHELADRMMEIFIRRPPVR
jgi:CheY-like chemotaxis protein